MFHHHLGRTNMSHYWVFVARLGNGEIGCGGGLNVKDLCIYDLTHFGNVCFFFFR